MISRLYLGAGVIGVVSILGVRQASAAIVFNSGSPSSYVTGAATYNPETTSNGAYMETLASGDDKSGSYNTSAPSGTSASGAGSHTFTVNTTATEAHLTASGSTSADSSPAALGVGLFGVQATGYIDLQMIFDVTNDPATYNVDGSLGAVSPGEGATSYSRIQLSHVVGGVPTSDVFLIQTADFHDPGYVDPSIAPTSDPLPVGRYQLRVIASVESDASTNGAAGYGGNPAQASFSGVTFNVASVPEPGVAIAGMLGLGAAALRRQPRQPRRG